MLTEQEIKLRDIGGYHRKPTSWKEVGLPIPLELLEGLKQYTALELGIANIISRGFKMIPEECVFLVESDNGVYLVDTEGAQYVRYIRYVGHFMPPKRDIVKMPDNDRAVEITKISGRYFWSFPNWPEPKPTDKPHSDDFTVNGPFRDRQDAINDAMEYCGESAT